MDWHKIDNLRWLTGSIRRDLTPAQRSVWADLLCLAGLSRRQGYVERSAGIPYEPQELSDLFRIDLNLLNMSINLCAIEGRLTVLEDGTLYITNWLRWQANGKRKPEMDEAQQIAWQRRLDNLNPDVSIEVLQRDFRYLISDQHGKPVDGKGQ